MISTHNPSSIGFFALSGDSADLVHPKDIGEGLGSQHCSLRGDDVLGDGIVLVDIVCEEEELLVQTMSCGAFGS